MSQNEQIELNLKTMSKLKKRIEIEIMVKTIFDANDRMISVAECAEFKGKHENTILNHLKKGLIIGQLRGGEWEIPKLQFYKELIEEFLRKQRLKAA